MEGLVFLDFDGVICDSLLECLVSSWEAYFRLYLRKTPFSVDVCLLRQFSLLRPYVRSGEDFVLVQELIAAGTPIHSQEAFDRELEQRGKERISLYRELFYSARSEMLESRQGYWMALNKIYPHVSKLLPRWAKNPCLYILSTKEPSYILAILGSVGIRFDPQRILSCDRSGKAQTIMRTLARSGMSRAVFIDDQIDYLVGKGLRDGPITGFLASWGYVKEQWLDGSQPVAVLRPGELQTILDRWLRCCPLPGP